MCESSGLRSRRGSRRAREQDATLYEQRLLWRTRNTARPELVLIHEPGSIPSQTQVWLQSRSTLARHHHVRLASKDDMSRLRGTSGQAPGSSSPAEAEGIGSSRRSSSARRKWNPYRLHRRNESRHAHGWHVRSELVDVSHRSGAPQQHAPAEFSPSPSHRSHASVALALLR